VAPPGAHLRERIREHGQAAVHLRQIAYWVVLGFGAFAAFLIIASQVSGIGRLPGFAFAEQHRLALAEFAGGSFLCSHDVRRIDAAAPPCRDALATRLLDSGPFSPGLRRPRWGVSTGFGG
jgi:hypothetical protein